MHVVLYDYQGVLPFFRQDIFLNRYFSGLHFVIKVPVYYVIMLMGPIGIRYFKKLIILSYQFKRKK